MEGPSLPLRNLISFPYYGDLDSTHYPQSNGKAEATVKFMKKILRAVWNGRFLHDEQLCKVLLQICNTPSTRDRLSPAQKLFGHLVQDTFPVHSKSFAWQTSVDEAKSKAVATQQCAKNYYNTGTRYLPDIQHLERHCQYHQHPSGASLTRLSSHNKRKPQRFVEDPSWN